MKNEKKMSSLSENQERVEEKELARLFPGRHQEKKKKKKKKPLYIQKSS